MLSCGSSRREMRKDVRQSELRHRSGAIVWHSDARAHTPWRTQPRTQQNERRANHLVTGAVDEHDVRGRVIPCSAGSGRGNRRRVQRTIIQLLLDGDERSCG